MMIQHLQKIFRRDLEKLKQEINAYSKEGNLWITGKGISNSGGNLCLHLIGNLNTYIGAEFGKTGYIRNRDLEFSLKDVPKAELISKIDDTISVVEKGLGTLQEADLEKEYPVKVFAEEMSTGYFLMHLTAHLAYHLGQINYHRRLLDI